jgi:Ni,Fe-hydrogenase III small subunit/Pyruvate/2-oxoacid:ferredoxin oxidoreductase delta subunit
MLEIIRTRLRQGYRTMAYPAGPAPELPPLFAGRPVLSGGKCPPGCRLCAESCPTGAIQTGNDSSSLRLDTGLCIFCGDCRSACSSGAIDSSRDHRMAAARREVLVVAPGEKRIYPLLPESKRKLFAHSLKLRQVSAGGCNACEADTNVLGTLAWDIGRFGIQFVASPRHADGILVTGPVTENMRTALLKTYEAVPAPKIVIAVGSCAVSGGLYAGHAETHGGVSSLLPVDLFIPGCPPHPLTILDGLLSALGAIR